MSEYSKKKTVLETIFKALATSTPQFPYEDIEAAYYALESVDTLIIVMIHCMDTGLDLYDVASAVAKVTR